MMHMKFAEKHCYIKIESSYRLELVHSQGIWFSVFGELLISSAFQEQSLRQDSYHGAPLIVQKA